MSVIIGLFLLLVAGACMVSFFACCLLTVVFLFGEPIRIRVVALRSALPYSLPSAFGAWAFYKLTLICVSMAHPFLAG